MFLRSSVFVCCICTFLRFLLVQSYENLALNKQVVNIIGDDDLNVLVNGRKIECVNEVLPYFRIDLGEILSVHHVIAYYGKWGEFPWGFSVYVSNTTYHWNGTWCWGDHVDNVSLTITNQCLSYGRFVTYDDLSMWIDSSLCEVEVYGCPIPGHYGENCSIPCPQNCQERRCNINEGTCLGCIEGYKGPTCKTKCDSGSYGLDCSGKCGECSGDNQCHHISGTCFSGCKPGFLGLRCDRECNNGTFGHGCNEMCGNCIESGQCHHVNGTCLKGCDPGYLGHRCDQECLSGSYGKQCNESCGPNCNSCNNVNGICDLGCNVGWNGTFCEQKCDNGSFGQGCTEMCGNCLENDQCHHVNGTCLNGCDPGYLGLRCDQDGSIL